MWILRELGYRVLEARMEIRRCSLGERAEHRLLFTDVGCQG